METITNKENPRHYVNIRPEHFGEIAIEVFNGHSSRTRMHNETGRIGLPNQLVTAYGKRILVYKGREYNLGTYTQDKSVDTMSAAILKAAHGNTQTLEEDKVSAPTLKEKIAARILDLSYKNSKRWARRNENTEYILNMFPEYKTEPYVDTYTTPSPNVSGIFLQPDPGHRKTRRNPIYAALDRARA